MSRHDDLDRILDDLKYLITWGVDLDENKRGKRAEIYTAMDMEKAAANEWPIFVDITPSETYIQRAVQRFQAMDWSKFEAGASDVGATSHLYKSDPDNPVCSNDQER